MADKAVLGVAFLVISRFSTNDITSLILLFCMSLMLRASLNVQVSDAGQQDVLDRFCSIVCLDFFSALAASRCGKEAGFRLPSLWQKRYKIVHQGLAASSSILSSHTDSDRYHRKCLHNPHDVVDRFCLDVRVSFEDEVAQGL